MEGLHVHGQNKWQNLALCTLVLLLASELMLLEFKAEWLWSTAQALLPESDFVNRLKRCPADVRVLKSQHFATLTMLLPLKAVCFYMCCPLRFQNLRRRGLLDMAWGLLVILLYTLLGIVFAYIVLFQLPGASSLSSRSVLANLGMCAQPTLAYGLKLSVASFIAAVCLWPLIAIASSLLHWLFVRVATHIRPARVRQE